MFVITKWNDSTITVETFDSPESIEMTYGVMPTFLHDKGETKFMATGCGSEVERAFITADRFEINPNGTVEYDYIDNDYNIIAVTLFATYENTENTEGE